MKFQLSKRKLILILADIAMLMTCGVFSAFFLTLANILMPPYWVMFSACIATILSVMALWISGAYAKLWRSASRCDYLRCIYGVLGGDILTALIVQLSGHPIRIYYWLLYAVTACAATCVFRYLFRHTFLTLANQNCIPDDDGEHTRLLIIGAGKATKMLLSDIKRIQQVKNNPASRYLPVGIVDDNLSLGGNTLDGVEIVGTTAEIPKICVRDHIDLILFAIPSCEEEDRTRIISICKQTELPIKVLPFLSQLVLSDEPEQQNLLSQVKDISIEGLLGREPVSFDKSDIEKLICGTVCMVTGGGGSIGGELVRQIAKYQPAQIILVDIYENNAYEIQQEMLMEYGSALNLVVLIASVRDYPRMDEIFRKYRPDLVFHAAAHKHVPLMEHSPMEAIKNNIIGTFNTATLADFYRVKKFVMISTDKAVNPTNVMGASKRCCEMIVQYMAQSDTNTEFVTTRFGNVLGSHGSVIPLFKKQIETGQPLTVTHPDIIRYFMTIPEAVSLVLQAGAMAQGGEIFVLDMGDPVKITTLAENLIRMYGKVPYKDVEIRFTGLRPGEKLFEELLMNEEGLCSTRNKKIFIGNQLAINQITFMKKLDELRTAANQNDAEETIALLSELVPTFHHIPMELHDEPVKQHSVEVDTLV